VRYFLKLAEQINVQPALLSIYRQPALWNALTLRTATPGSPHAAADDILLRMEPLDGSLPERQCVWYQAARQLPEVRALVMALCAQVGCEQLGRVMVTRLAPGAVIPRHRDVGPHPLQYCRFRFWGRYHLVLQTDPAAVFTCEDEVVHMAQGELWYFRNDLEHSVEWFGEGQQDRLHVIADIHTANEPDREGDPC
jgi:hypothetical protein